MQAKRPARTEDVSDEEGVVVSARASKKVRNLPSALAGDEHGVVSRYDDVCLISVSVLITLFFCDFSAPHTPTRTVKKKADMYVLLSIVGAAYIDTTPARLPSSYLMMTMNLSYLWPQNGRFFSLISLLPVFL